MPGKPTYEELKTRIAALEKESFLLKQTQKALKDREELLETVINNLPHQIFWKDKSLDYLGCNRRFAVIVGLDNPGSIKGMTDYDFNRDKTHAASYRKWDRQIIDSKKSVLDLEENYHDNEGNEGTVLTSKVPVYDDEGNCICIVGICTDITERKQVENELKEALENVRTLTGLLPICAKCKKIRDDKGYWNNLESYIQEHSDVSFSHGMCADCSDELYGSENWYIKMKKNKKE